MNGTGHRSLAAQIGDASNVLVLEPGGECADDGCFDLLMTAPPSLENVLGVVFDRSPDEWLNAWRRRSYEPPAKMGVVGVGDSTRSVEADAAGTLQTPRAPIQVTVVRDPGDLETLESAIRAYLDEWEDDGNRVAVCLDSISDLLDHADLPNVYHFLHVFTSRFARENAIAHAHLDPNAHDRETVRTVSSLFDTVVEVETGDSRTVA